MQETTQNVSLHSGFFSNLIVGFAGIESLPIPVVAISCVVVDLRLISCLMSKEQVLLICKERALLQTWRTVFTVSSNLFCQNLTSSNISCASAAVSCLATAVHSFVRRDRQDRLEYLC